MSELWKFEHQCYDEGFEIVCGVDEAGRGPLAGPVCAAAVILPRDLEIEGLNDSKKLSDKRRRALFEQITAQAVSYGIAFATEQEIDEINILQATFLAMRRAMERLTVRPSIALIDGNRETDFGLPVRTIVKGKRVVLVDDSIVRGTTSRRIVTMLKEAGATEVHVRIASPPMTHPCFYGVDTSTRDELISARKEVDGVRAEICADSLAFLSPGALLRAGNRKDLCMACFTGHYPTALYQSVDEVNKDVKC